MRAYLVVGLFVLVADGMMRSSHSTALERGSSRFRKQTHHLQVKIRRRNGQGCVTKRSRLVLIGPRLTEKSHYLQ
eukprot:7947131-Heterocapsa_arctica.AAC.1